MNKTTIALIILLILQLVLLFFNYQNYKVSKIFHKTIMIQEYEKENNK